MKGFRRSLQSLMNSLAAFVSISSLIKAFSYAIKRYNVIINNKRSVFHKVVSVRYIILIFFVVGP